MGTINYLQAIKPDTAYIKKIINNSLLFDWAVRVEYQDGAAESAGWQLWGSPFFALRSAELVLESLKKCYMNNPACTIRLSAEKIQPQSSFLYTVYSPGVAGGEQESTLQGARSWLSHARREKTGVDPRLF